MALTKLNVARALTGATPVANGGTALTSGFVNGGGLTSASTWRLTTAFTGDASPIASDLEEVDTDGYGSIGSDMTQSSGIFTFPSTGIWYIKAQLGCSATGAIAYHTIAIHTTTNNSTYNSAADCNANFAHSSGTYHGSTSCDFIFDVTDTANCKVKFVVDNAASHSTKGNTDNNATYFHFMRLGDT
tara:strand:- start:2306 stop:2866 length:561 start_codon:yes stop_codon:yes gene_type:complete